MSSALFLKPLLWPLLAILLPTLLALWFARRANRAAARSEWGSLSAGVLAGVALMMILPETSGSLGCLMAGAAMFALVDRFVHPLCAGCGGGPAWPLWTALGVHSLLDGALLELAQPGSFAASALALHRVPESLALVALLRTSARSPRHLNACIVAISLLVLAGYGLASGLHPAWLRPGYAFAAGGVFFLSLHRLHRSWQERSLRWSYSFTGAAAVCVLQYVSHYLGQ
jgi:zinc transporter ZupT